MAEHMRQSQIELNELLTEYWKLRHATGVLSYPLIWSLLYSRLMVEVYMETLANKLGMQVTST